MASRHREIVHSGLAAMLLLASACAEATADFLSTGGDTSAPSSAESTTGSGGNPSAGGASTIGSGATGGGGGSLSTTSSTTVASSSGTGNNFPPGTVIFTEYVEGSSNNKAIEITNLGPTPVDLSACHIDRYQNGATMPAASPVTFTASTLASKASYVFCHSSFSMVSLCDEQSVNIAHSGNDVVALVCNDMTKDVFGRIGEDATWGTTPTISEDATLRRGCSVDGGDTNGNDAFDPGTEWSGFPVDTFSDLGQFVCP